MTRDQPQKGSVVQDVGEFALQVSLLWDLRVSTLPVSGKESQSKSWATRRDPTESGERNLGLGSYKKPFNLLLYIA